MFHPWPSQKITLFSLHMKYSSGGVFAWHRIIVGNWRKCSAVRTIRWQLYWSAFKTNSLVLELTKSSLMWMACNPLWLIIYEAAESAEVIPWLLAGTVVWMVSGSSACGRCASGDGLGPDCCWSDPGDSEGTGGCCSAPGGSEDSGCDCCVVSGDGVISACPCFGSADTDDPGGCCCAPGDSGDSGGCCCGGGGPNGNCRRCSSSCLFWHSGDVLLIWMQWIISSAFFTIFWTRERTDCTFSPKSKKCYLSRSIPIHRCCS